MEEEAYARRRELMVRSQLEERGIDDPAVLSAMRKLPRHLFVPEHLQHLAYSDQPLPIGPDQTISQPYIVALMLQSLRLARRERVLEIGTGSGYQAALLALLSKEVYSVELDLHRAEQSELLLRSMELDVKIKCGNGFEGWREHAPFDAIILSAAPDHVPRELVSQLSLDGRLLLPLGEDRQVLVMFEKTKQGLVSKELGSVRFVGMKRG